MLYVLGVGDSVVRGDIPQELRLRWYDLRCFSALRSASVDLFHAWFGATGVRRPFHARPSVHRGKPVAEFPHHHVERGGVARGFDDVHERLDAELCAGVKRVGFPEQGRVGLADGDSNRFCGHLALRHEFVDGLDDFVHMFVLKKPDDSGFDCIS